MSIEETETDVAESATEDDVEEQEDYSNKNEGEGAYRSRSVAYPAADDERPPKGCTALSLYIATVDMIFTKRGLVKFQDLIEARLSSSLRSVERLGLNLQPIYPLKAAWFTLTGKPVKVELKSEAWQTHKWTSLWEQAKKELETSKRLPIGLTLYFFIGKEVHLKKRAAEERSALPSKRRIVQRRREKAAL